MDILQVCYSTFIKNELHREGSNPGIEKPSPGFLSTDIFRMGVVQAPFDLGKLRFGQAAMFAVLDVSIKAKAAAS